MTTTTLPNKGYIQVTAGSELDTWGPYLNTNMNTADTNLGGVATIAVSSGIVNLSSAQYSCNFLVFTGTLNSDVDAHLNSIGIYTVQNLCSNTSAFILKISQNFGGAKFINVPPIEPIDLVATASDTRFRNLGRIGSYLDIASSVVPNWITGCFPPPYLLCDGSAFSATDYPALASMLGGTTLPDLRGRAKFALNDGSVASITLSNGGFSGDTFLASGGSQSTIVSSNNLDFWASSVFGAAIDGAYLGASGNNLFSVTVGTTATPYSNIPPAIAHGITLIRAG